MRILRIAAIIGCLTIVLSACHTQKNSESQLESVPVPGPPAESYQSEPVSANNALDISIDGHIISIQQIPELAAYLKEQDDPQLEISRLRVSEVARTSTAAYILLEYGCGNKNCSASLLKVSGSDLSSFPLGYGTYMKSLVTDTLDRAVFQFGANEGGEIIRSYIVPVDLVQMKAIPFKTTVNTEQYNREPIWPILNITWVDNTQLKLTVPDLKSSDFNTLQQWFLNDNRKSKDVFIELVN